MNQADSDRTIYNLAKQFLVDLPVEGVTPALIEAYLNYPQVRKVPQQHSDLYFALLTSAQTGGMTPRVVGEAINGLKNLGIVLFDFDPFLVLETYQNDAQGLLDDIESKLQPRGQIRRTTRGIWPKYCQTILSGAEFLTRFASVQEFSHWIDFFDQDDRARLALPLLLSQEIDGLGFALACDFLIGLGYQNFAKPDVHIRDIFTALQLCKPRVSDYQLLKAVVRVAHNAQVTPYAADKVFWLIGSGNFYEDPHIGKNGRVGRYKAKFIAYAQQLLGLTDA